MSGTDYKSTLNLPETAFAMKADLAQKEPRILEGWAKDGLYAQILAARAGAPLYVLHDGPPYANGNIHYGHILNKTLKDIVVKMRTMMGCYVEYRPGWDCHGLPIELAVLRELGDKAQGLSALEIRRACHAYAMKWVDTQRSEFQRLGVFGTWDRPYLTLTPDYEATIVRELAAFARAGLLYRDRKPVHWCMSDRTALAEAEIEYDDAHTSPSIYVRFQIEGGADPLYAVIWTTTPWTLPANLAIAYHPRFDYVTVRARGARHIVARELADQVIAAAQLREDGPREPFPVARFAELRAARHPFLERESVFLPAEHVTLEAGTGLVHTAPGHGADDYALGRQHGLAPYAPVDDAGCFTEGPWQGEHVWKANPKIVEHLDAGGALLSPRTLSVTHSYPICWRCKKPIIFRATFQWFARMDAASAPDGARPAVDLRSVALAEIERTTFIPPWGQNRLRGMIENRPDWVLSRQRVWGVPIPVLYDRDAPGQVLDASPAFMDKVAALIEREGADAWYARSAAELAQLAGLPADVAARAEKSNDIVDVWFESGVSGAAVCLGRKGLDASTPADPRPVDLYLEGSDQHRGWFHSALLTGCATRGHAPYRTLLTHGFVLDERGRPYSKSEIEKQRREGKKVEFIPPADIIQKQGAELLRMWVAQADFRSDVAFSRAHLDQLGDSYRKVRNTIRFLLGNLAGWTPPGAADVPDLSDELDWYMWHRAGDLARRLRAAYDQTELHVVLRAIVDFCVVDLSARYCDVRKDRLYCDARTDARRAATQQVLYRCLRVVTCGMAPILCFTAEEVWSHLPRRPGDPPSVHLALLEDGEPGTKARDEALSRWDSMWQLRQDVQKALEPFRAQKKSSLDAHVTLVMPEPEHSDAGRYPEAWLADFFIVSRVSIERGAPAIRVADATGHACARCWKWTPEQPLCTRCASVVHPS